MGKLLRPPKCYPYIWFLYTLARPAMSGACAVTPLHLFASAARPRHRPPASQEDTFLTRRMCAF